MAAVAHFSHFKSWWMCHLLFKLGKENGGFAIIRSVLWLTIIAGRIEAAPNDGAVAAAEETR